MPPRQFSHVQAAFASVPTAPSVVLLVPSTSLSTVRTSPGQGEEKRAQVPCQVGAAPGGSSASLQGCVAAAQLSSFNALCWPGGALPPTRRPSHPPECPGKTLRSGGSAATWAGATGSGWRSAPSTCSPDSPTKWLSPQLSTSTSVSSRHRSRPAPGAAAPATAAAAAPLPWLPPAWLARSGEQLGGAAGAGPRADVKGRPLDPGAAPLAGCRGCSTGWPRAVSGASPPPPAVTMSNGGAAAAAAPPVPLLPWVPGGDSWRAACLWSYCSMAFSAAGSSVNRISSACCSASVTGWQRVECKVMGFQQACEGQEDSRAAQQPQPGSKQRQHTNACLPRCRAPGAALHGRPGRHPEQSPRACRHRMGQLEAQSCCAGGPACRAASPAHAPCRSAPAATRARFQLTARRAGCPRGSCCS